MIENYGAICLNENKILKIKKSHEKYVDNEKRFIKLKNTGTSAWPKGSQVSCLGDKSTLNVLLSQIPIGQIFPNKEIDLEIDFDIPKKIKAGTYFCYLKLYDSSNKIFFGDEICFTIILEERNYYHEYLQMKGEYLNKMKNMGEFFDLPIEIISHKALITA